MLLFAQLRIADEHKDHQDDCRWRPERPVPRGLVSLRELRAVGVAAAVVQIAATALLDIRLTLLLLLVWGWMALMSVEFFAPAWLKARPVTYLISHMMVMPLIALFAVACGTRAEVLIHPAVGVFLALAFLNGLVLEVARKCWAPADEREGVETYSRLWGMRRSAAVVTVAGLSAAGLAWIIQALLSLPWGFALMVAVGAAWLVVSALRYIRQETTKAATRLETASGLFVLVIYLAVAWLPAVQWMWGGVA